MPTPTIEEIASSVTAILDARVHGAQAAQREAKRLADERTQRESEQAAKAQQEAIRAEFEQLLALQQSLKAEIESKRSAHDALTRELPVLGARFSATLGELARMRERYPILKG